MEKHTALPIWAAGFAMLAALYVYLVAILPLGAVAMFDPLMAHGTIAFTRG